MALDVTHVRTVYECGRCGRTHASVHELPHPDTPRFCTGTYDTPHSRSAMTCTIYDLVPIKRSTTPEERRAALDELMRLSEEIGYR